MKENGREELDNGKKRLENGREWLENISMHGVRADGKEWLENGRDGKGEENERK